jgi:hypothetical protein
MAYLITTRHRAMYCLLARPRTHTQPVCTLPYHIKNSRLLKCMRALLAGNWVFELLQGEWALCTNTLSCDGNVIIAILLRSRSCPLISRRYTRCWRARLRKPGGSVWKWRCVFAWILCIVNDTPESDVGVMLRITSAVGKRLVFILACLNAVLQHDTWACNFHVFSV